MKNSLLILIALFTLTACGGGNQPKKNAEVTTAAEVKQKDCIEVLYFHGKKRCITCNAIENLTKEVVDKNFAEQVKNGEIVFKIIDISQPENEAIAEKYEVTWSSLFINKWEGEKETINNMTEFGFANAKNSPDAFKEGVLKKLNELSNQQ